MKTSSSEVTIEATNAIQHLNMDAQKFNQHSLLGQHQMPRQMSYSVVPNLQAPVDDRKFLLCNKKTIVEPVIESPTEQSQTSMPPEPSMRANDTSPSSHIQFPRLDFTNYSRNGL